MESAAAGSGTGDAHEREVTNVSPLAFVAPRVIAAIADGSMAGATVTRLAQRLPDSWAEQERRHKV